MKVVGIQNNVTFSFNNDGKDVKGTGIRLFLTGERDGVEGVFCETVFFSSTKPGFSKACALSLGDEVIVAYNRYRKAEDIFLSNGFI